jgi:hypothetical protein
MKKTWNTPECKELTWDKTMSGEDNAGEETTNYPCTNQPGDLKDGNFSYYPKAACLSS